MALNRVQLRLTDMMSLTEHNKHKTDIFKRRSSENSIPAYAAGRRLQAHAAATHLAWRELAAVWRSVDRDAAEVAGALHGYKIIGQLAKRHQRVLGSLALEGRIDADTACVLGGLYISLLQQSRGQWLAMLPAAPTRKFNRVRPREVL